jgi:chromosome partitioning protein
MLIAVLNQKGGVGKSTIAMHLAACAHLKGKRVLLLDLDRQGTAVDWYAARADDSKLAGLVTVKVERAISAPKFIDVSKGYDVAVCDGPPRLAEITRSAAVAADVVVIPLRPGACDLWAADETIQLLDQADATRADLGRDPVRRVFMLNGAVTGTRIARQVTEALAELGTKRIPVIHNRVVFAESVATGECAMTSAPDGPAAREIRELYKWVTKKPSKRRRAA